jgi:hypothetical protein
MLATARVSTPFLASKKSQSGRPATCITSPKRIATVTLAYHDQKQKLGDDAPALPHATLATAGLVAPLLLDNPAALAIGREYGIIEGQIFSLIHPAMMFFLFGSSVYAGYLGFQWRRTRELASEIKALKAQRAPAKVGPDGEAVTSPPSSLDEQISALEAERKQLIGQKLNEKHNNWGSLLLGLGVLISVSGALNTFLRTGKLFPGPHLYAGAAITVLWALAAALVPSMQKGNETARSLHIAFNTLNVLLFAWQIPTGLEIVGKVFQFTTLP